VQRKTRRVRVDSPTFKGAGSLSAGFSNCFGTPPGSLIYPTMSRPTYLCRKLTQPLPTRDGVTLRTVRDARAYMLRAKERGSAPPWQRAAALLLAEADIGAFSNQSSLRCSTTANLTLPHNERRPHLAAHIIEPLLPVGLCSPAFPEIFRPATAASVYCLSIRAR